MKKCTQCEEKFDDFFMDQECEACFNNRFEYASRVVKFDPEGSETTLFDEDYNLETLSDDLPEPIKSQKWVATDGWRGYTDWEFLDGFVEVAEGWVTSWPDETVSKKAELAEYFQELMAGDLVAPCDIYWVFGNTSNIFSTASSIVINAGDEELLEEWLLEINGGLEEFKEKFQ